MKKFMIAFLLLTTGCSQESLIFLRNIGRVDLNLIKQIAKDTGIEEKQTTNRAPITADLVGEKVQLPVAEKIPREDKIIRVREGDEFIIELPARTNFVVLKSITGDIVFKKDISSEDKGIFVFNAGSRDSRINFEIISLEGEKIKRVIYYINVIRKSSEAKTEGEAAQKSSISSSAKSVEKEEITNVAGAEKKDMGIESLAESIIRSNSYSQAVKELGNLISSEDVSDSDKEIVRYYLIDIFLSKKEYTKAEGLIQELKNEGRRFYYRGKLSYMKGKVEDSYIFYRLALEKGDDTTKKMSIRSFLELLRGDKLIKLDDLKRIEEEIRKFKTDSKFYGTSMIEVADLYIYFKDVYTAEKILKDIISGNFDKEVKSKAEKLYEELKKGFLDYR